MLSLSLSLASLARARLSLSLLFDAPHAKHAQSLHSGTTHSRQLLIVDTRMHAIAQQTEAFPVSIVDMDVTDTLVAVCGISQCVFVAIAITLICFKRRAVIALSPHGLCVCAVLLCIPRLEIFISSLRG